MFSFHLFLKFFTSFFKKAEQYYIHIFIIFIYFYIFTYIYVRFSVSIHPLVGNLICFLINEYNFHGISMQGMFAYIHTHIDIHLYKINM